MYLVISGLVKIVSFSEDGKEVLLNHIWPGEVLGEIGIMDGRTRTASAYCSKSSTLISIPRIAFFQFLETHPKFYKTIISQLCNYLRLNTEVIEDTVFYNRYQKIGKKLLQIRSKQKGESDVVEISQEELGNMLGLSREITNKSLQDLQKKQIIDLKRSQITILNENELNDIIGGGKL